jgi:hypothetical protein
MPDKHGRGSLLKIEATFIDQFIGSTDNLCSFKVASILKISPMPSKQ